MHFMYNQQCMHTQLLHLVHVYIYNCQPFNQTSNINNTYIKRRQNRHGSYHQSYYFLISRSAPLHPCTSVLERASPLFRSLSSKVCATRKANVQCRDQETDMMGQQEKTRSTEHQGGSHRRRGHLDRTHIHLSAVGRRRPPLCRARPPARHPGWSQGETLASCTARTWEGEMKKNGIRHPLRHV